MPRFGSGRLCLAKAGHVDTHACAPKAPKESPDHIAEDFEQSLPTGEILSSEAVFPGGFGLRFSSFRLAHRYGFELRLHPCAADTPPTRQAGHGRGAELDAYRQMAAMPGGAATVDTAISPCRVNECTDMTAKTTLPSAQNSQRQNAQRRPWPAEESQNRNISHMCASTVTGICITSAIVSTPDVATCRQLPIETPRSTQLAPNTTPEFDCDTV